MRLSEITIHYQRGEGDGEGRKRLEAENGRNSERDENPFVLSLFVCVCVVSRLITQEVGGERERW